MLDWMVRKMELSFRQYEVLKRALNLLWDKTIQRDCPKEVASDLDKYHQWCLLEEKYEYSDLMYIQQCRKKLDNEISKHK